MSPPSEPNPEPDLLSGLWSAERPPQLAPRDWERLLAQARSARLLARVAHVYAARGWWAAVPPGPALHLESARRLADRLRYEVLWEVEQLQRALKGIDTPLVLLKGAAYVVAGLPPGPGRLFSDVDIMVRRDRLPEVESALLAAGWIAQKLTPYDDRYYRQWMHELPPLQHVLRRTYLDVHHTIAPPTSRFAVDGALLLAQTVPLPDHFGMSLPGRPNGEYRSAQHEGTFMSLLAPVDMVLHSAVHLLQEGDFSGGLRDLLDLNDLLLHFGRDAAFWPALLQRAPELQAAVPLHHALTQVERLFGTRPPEELAATVAALAPPAARHRLMARLLTLALVPDHPSCDSRWTAAARQALYLRSHWLRMPWYQIAPHLLRKAWMRAVTRRDKPKAADAAAGAVEP